VPTLDPFDAWLWATPDDALAALRLDGLRTSTVADGIELPHLTVITLVSDGADPAEALAARVGSIEAVRASDSVTLLLVRRAGNRHYVIALWDVGDGVFHLIGSIPATDPAWKRVEESWLNAVAPTLTRVMLNRADFEAIGDALAEHGDIQTTRMTARVLNDQSSYTRGWPNVGVKRPTHREAMEEAYDMLVRTLTLDVGGHTQLQIRRSSGASFYRGNYGVFASIVLGRLKAAAGQRRKLLADRSRQPRAVANEVICMAIDQVDLDKALNRRYLREAIAGVKGLQVASMHRNPYMHLLVTDYLNGTNCDILVTESNEVRIIPGIDSSVGSLARITEAIGGAVGMTRLTLEKTGGLVPDSAFLSS
jgi:hypothetical protein